MSEVPGPLGRYLREPVNALTHGVGAIAAAAGLVLLLVQSEGEPYRLASALVYGISLITLYTASTLLHAVRAGARTTRVLRLLDHAAIFALIAGSYTPVTLVTLQAENPAWGWTLFAVAWGFALLGIVFKLAWAEAPRWVSTGLYLAMGWLAVIAIVPITRALPPGGVTWLAAGGVIYSLGAVVYGAKWPDPRPPWFGYHELWHLFVLAGSACHYVMVLRYVLPA